MECNFITCWLTMKSTVLNNDHCWLAAFRHGALQSASIGSPRRSLAIIGKRNLGGRCACLWVISCVSNRDVFVTYGYRISFQLNFYCTITSFVCRMDTPKKTPHVLRNNLMHRSCRMNMINPDPSTLGFETVRSRTIKNFRESVMR